MQGETQLPAATEQGMEMIDHVRVGYYRHPSLRCADRQVVDGEIIVFRREVDRFVELPRRTVMPEAAKSIARVPEPELAGRFFVMKGWVRHNLPH